MTSPFALLLLLASFSRAYAVDPADVRRLAADPDTTAEALAAGVRATEEAPRDPQALAALIEAIEAARGPTLPGGPVKSAALGDGARSVQIVYEDGTRRAFDTRTGAPVEGFAPVQAASAKGTVTAGDGVCVVTMGGPLGVLADCTSLVAGAVSPDGKRAITLHAPTRTERTEVLWDVSTGKPVATLRTDVNPAGTWVARFSPDGTRLFTYDNGGLVEQRLIDAATGATVAVLGPSQRDGAFVGDRLVLVDADLQAFDADGALVGRLPDASGWAQAAFLGDGHTIALTRGGRTTLWDLDDGGVVEVLGAWDVRGSDGRLVLSGRPGGPVRVVDTGPAGAVVRGDPGAPLAAVAMAPDGALGSADALRVRLWNADGEQVLDAPSANVRWLAFAGSRLVASTGEAWDLDGNRVATSLFRYLEQVVPGPVAYSYDRTGSAPSRFRDLIGGTTRARVAKDTAITGGSFSADGARFAGAAPSGVGVWEVASGRRLLSEGDGAGWTVAISGDGTRVAGFARDARDVSAWTVDGGSPWLRVKLRSVASAVALDGDVVAIGDVAGRLWLHRPGEDPVATAGHEGPIGTLAFSGGLLLSSSPGEVRLWDAATGTLLVAWPAATVPLARFGPDVVLFAAADGTTEVWPATVAGWQAIACGWITNHPAGDGVCD